MSEQKISVDQRRAQTAVEILKAAEDAVHSGRSADHFLAQLYRENRKYGSKDRKFYSSVVFAWFRWRGILTPLADHRSTAMAIAAFLDTGRASAPLSALGLPDQLATCTLPDTACAKINRLRELVPECAEVTPSQVLPNWVIPTCTPENYDDAAFEDMCVEAFQKRPPTWFRLSSKSCRKDLEALRKELPDLKPLPGSDGTCCTMQRFNLSHIQKRIAPGLEIQDLASQCVGLICAPQKDEEWWDVCAGSGGKALHLADLMRNQGQIVATDIRTQVLRNLSKRAARAKASCIRTAHVESLAGLNKEFDGILIDAPCSSIGTWSRNPDARWRINEHYISDRASVQQELLETAVSHLKVGGRLVYSVCTLSRAETTDVINTFLNKHPEFTLIPTQHPLRNESTSGMLQIFPWDGPCNGMFVAVLTRS